MGPLDLLIWHYIPGAIIAALCLLLIRAVARAWLNRNQLHEQRQMAHNINAMREWHKIQAPVQCAMDEWMRTSTGSREYRRAGEAVELACAQRDEDLAAWRHKWGIKR